MIEEDQENEDGDTVMETTELKESEETIDSILARFCNERSCGPRKH
jgi:hypothetical protein